MEAPDPGKSVYQLAIALRNEGLPQVALYRVFSDQFTQLADEDPRYDALADTMDEIWYKGRLYDEALSDLRLGESRNAAGC